MKNVSHYNYCHFQFYSRILLQLKPKATLSKYVKPIGLPKKDWKIPANIKCAVAGWGRTGADKPSSPVLRENTEKTQFPFECKNIWKEYFDVGRNVCTKFDKKKGGVCQVNHMKITLITLPTLKGYDFLYY